MSPLSSQKSAFTVKNLISQELGAGAESGAGSGLDHNVEQ